MLYHLRIMSFLLAALVILPLNEAPGARTIIDGG